MRGFLVAVLVMLAAVLLAPQAAWAACSNPAGIQGDMLYNGDYDVMQYCDGSGWIGMGMGMGGADDVLNGLVGWWKFDEGAGGSAADAIGGNDGTLTNGPTWVTGPYGTAVEFDGTDDHIDLGIFDVTGSAITLAAWVRMDSFPGSDPRIIAKSESSGATSPYWSLDSENDTSEYRFRVRTSGATIELDGGNIVFGEWAHVVGVYDGSFMRLYQNGQEVASVAKTGTINTSATAPVFIADDPNTTWDRFVDGLIDDVRIYNRALSAAEVATIYNATRRDYESGLVGWWKLDEGAGGTAADSSGSGNTGTLTNGPVWSSGKFGGALEFADATDDYVNIPNDALLENIQEENYSVAAWYYPKSVPSGVNPDGIHSIMVKQGYHEGLLYREFSKFDMQHWLTGNVGAGVTSANTFPINQWHHAVGVVDKSAGTTTIYVNGVFENVANWTPDTAARGYGTATWKIGIANPASGTSRWAANGYVDDVRIYDRALSAAEVAALYRDTDTYCSVKGDLIFNHDTRVIQYCDGMHWIAASRSMNEDVTGGIVGWWKLDESGNVSTAADSSGKGNNGALTSFPADPSANWVAGKVDNALWFDGSNDYVAVNGVSTYSAVTPYSVSFWVKGGSVTDRKVYSEGNSGSGNPVFFMGTPSGGGSQIRVFIRNDASQVLLDATSTAIVFDDSWHHVTWTDHAGAGKLYINGSLDAVNFSYTPAGTITLNQIGFGAEYRNSVGSYFPGRIDDVRVYSRALSATEVEAIYRATRSDYNDGLVGHWELDDGAGSGTADSAGTNTGTLTNMDPDTDWVAGKLGAALDFDGTDDYVDIADFKPNNNDFTVAGWFLLDSNFLETDYAPLFGNNHNSPFLGYRGNVGPLWLHKRQHAGGEELETWMVGTDYADDQWHHAAIAVDQTAYTATLYLDGVSQGARGIGTEGYTHNNGDFHWIGRDWGSYWLGLIDDVRLYNRALPPEEIADLYNDTNGCTNPAGRSGDMMYNGDYDMMQYCDGKIWMRMQ